MVVMWSRAPTTQVKPQSTARSSPAATRSRVARIQLRVRMMSAMMLLNKTHTTSTRKDSLTLRAVQLHCGVHLAQVHFRTTRVHLRRRRLRLQSKLRRVAHIEVFEVERQRLQKLLRDARYRHQVMRAVLVNDLQSSGTLERQKGPKRMPHESKWRRPFL